MPKRRTNAKRLSHPRTAWVHIRTHQATLDAARRAAEQEGMSLSHWIELTMVVRLTSLGRTVGVGLVELPAETSLPKKSLNV